MQSRWMSMVEAWASTAIGFGVSLLVWALIVNPLYGFKTTVVQGLEVTAIFTVVSIIRGYYVRRMFNWLHSNKNKNKKELLDVLPLGNPRQS